MKLKLAAWLAAPVALLSIQLLVPVPRTHSSPAPPPPKVSHVHARLSPPATRVVSVPQVTAPTGMRAVVWKWARKARDCAIARGQIAPSANLAIIDYDMPSSQKRLWVVDPVHHKTLFSDWVAHGRGSGELMARQFSNEDGSFQTSLGVFRVGEVYAGKHGSSLRLDGLERGFNDRARERAIVMHSANYVQPEVVSRTGRLGRSQGCPAVREEVLDRVEQDLANGGMLFAYASQAAWMGSSTYLNCTT